MDDAVTSEKPYFGIEVTRHCNLRCPHCFTDSGGSSHPGPSTERLRRLLSELAAVGIRSVAFSGGEPLIRKDLCALIDYGKTVGQFDFALVTNGYFATLTLVQDLAKAGLQSVQVSVDGVDALDHSKVRACNPADFYRALRAIRWFKDQGLKVHIATIISPRNVERLPEMAMFCQALGVDGLRYCTFVPKGRATSVEQIQAYAVPPKKLDNFIAFVRKLNADPSAQFAITIDHALGPWTLDGTFRCDSGKRVAYISAEGDLYPCPSLIAAPFRVGNVFETPISELLESNAMACVRRIPRERIQGHCSTCSNRACQGGCRGAAFAVTGDVHGAVAYCHFSSSQRCES